MFKQDKLQKYAQEDVQFGTPDASKDGKSINDPTKSQEKSRANTPEKLFQALNMADASKLASDTAQEFQRFEVLTKSFHNTKKILETSRNVSLSFEISEDPCSGAKIDELKTFSAEEIVYIYNSLKSKTTAMLNLAKKLENNYKILSSILDQARKSDPKNQKVSTEDMEESDKIIKNNFLTVTDNFAEIAHDIVKIEREGNIYTQLLPVKQAYFDAASNLCLVQKEADITKDIIGFYTRDEMEALVSGYESIIVALQNYLRVYPTLRSMQAMSNESFKSNYQAIQKIIKVYKAKQYEVYKIVYNRLKPGGGSASK